MVEWLSLSEMAGWPVVKYMIQIIRKRVSKRIEERITVSLLECDAISCKYWCPIIFTLKVDSKTPAKLRVVGTDFVVFHHSSPIQSGFWRAASLLTTSGKEAEPIVIKGNDSCRVNLEFNPVMLGRWPASNTDWQVNATVFLDCAYGVISKQLESPPVIIDPTRWGAARDEFIRRFPSLIIEDS